IFALRALSKIGPDIFKTKIESIKNDHTIALTEKVIKTLETDFSFIHIAHLSKIEQKGKEAQKVEKQKGKSAIDEEVSDLIKSHDKADRKLAAELLSAIETEDSVSLLIELLNDTDSGVIKAAMNSAAELKKQELLPFVFDNLLKKNYKDAASDALKKYGEVAFPSLETIFYNSEQNVDIKIEIVNIYGKLGGDQAEDLLWNKIDYPDRNIVSQVLLSLSHCGFSAQEDQVQRIKIFIEEDIANIVWNLKAIEQLDGQSNTGFSVITDSLREENEHNYTHIYMLLSMIYDQKSIELVKENIETKTNEGISYAIELLDVFLSEDLKQKIIPILDDTSDIDIIRRLQMYYPNIEMSFDEIIKLLINREFNSINRWTKTSTIHYIGENKILGKFDMELIANLFNPDQLLMEISAWSMNEIDEDFYAGNSTRLEPDEEKHLQNLILGQKFENHSELRPHMMFEIVNFLKRRTLLGELPSYILASIVDYIDEVYLEDKTNIEPSDWHNECFYIIYDGVLEVKDLKGELIDTFKEGDFLGEQINIDLLEEGVSFAIVGDTVLLKINKNKFLDLITNEYEVTLKLLDS
ncbi:MAG: hypothetical protein KAI29_30260, partial [Cyclobacteriaceae bacterium]|nr:hypothetical protein [Cyclobacteriaceae bacterium]